MWCPPNGSRTWRPQNYEQEHFRDPQPGDEPRWIPRGGWRFIDPGQADPESEEPSESALAQPQEALDQRSASELSPPQSEQGQEPFQLREEATPYAVDIHPRLLPEEPDSSTLRPSHPPTSPIPELPSEAHNSPRFPTYQRSHPPPVTVPSLPMGVHDSPQQPPAHRALEQSATMSPPNRPSPSAHAFTRRDGEAQTSPWLNDRGSPQQSSSSQRVPLREEQGCQTSPRITSHYPSSQPQTQQPSRHLSPPSQTPQLSPQPFQDHTTSIQEGFASPSFSSFPDVLPGENQRMVSQEHWESWCYDRVNRQLLQEEDRVAPLPRGRLSEPSSLPLRNLPLVPHVDPSERLYQNLSRQPMAGPHQDHATSSGSLRNPPDQGFYRLMQNFPFQDAVEVADALRSINLDLGHVKRDPDLLRDVLFPLEDLDNRFPDWPTTVKDSLLEFYNWAAYRRELDLLYSDS